MIRLNGRQMRERLGELLLTNGHKNGRGKNGKGQDNTSGYDSYPSSSRSGR